MSNYFGKSECSENPFNNLISELTKSVILQLKKEYPFLFSPKEITNEKHKDLNEDTDLISVEEVRNMTSPPIGRTTLYYWQQNGKITAYKVGKRVYYSKKEMLIFLTSIKKKPPNRD